MISVKVIKKGKSLKQVELDSIKMLEADQEKVRQLGQSTLNEMHTQIESAIKHPDESTGELLNNTDLEYFADGVSWGVGNVSKMPIWWRIFNWGHTGYTIKAKNKKCLKFKGKDGEWVYRKSVIHTHPATNFLEETIHFLDNMISSFKMGGK